MAGLGIAIAWFGYWVLYYGVTQIKGDNYGFLDLGVPGRWAKAVGNRSDAEAASAAAAASANAANGPNPTGFAGQAEQSIVNQLNPFG